MKCNLTLASGQEGQEASQPTAEGPRALPVVWGWLLQQQLPRTVVSKQGTMGTLGFWLLSGPHGYCPCGHPTVGVSSHLGPGS